MAQAIILPRLGMSRWATSCSREKHGLPCVLIRVGLIGSWKFFVISDKTIGALYKITRRYTPEDSKLETHRSHHLVCHIMGTHVPNNWPASQPARPYLKFNPFDPSKTVGYFNVSTVLRAQEISTMKILIEFGPLRFRRHVGKNSKAFPLSFPSEWM